MSLRKRIRDLKLRTKFVFPISAILLASIIVISGYLIQRQVEAFRRELETKGETMICILAMQAESGVLFESAYELDELLGRLAVFEDIHAVMIFNKEHELLAHVGHWDSEANTITGWIDRGDPHHSQFYYVTDGSGREFIELNHPVLFRIEKLDRENLGITGGIDRSLSRGVETEEIGSVKLILSLDNVNEAISEAQTAAIVLTVVVTVLTIMILTFFVRFVTKPVKMLVEVTDQVSRGDLSQRVDMEQNDEIGQLGQTFNSMIESLKESRDEIEEYNRTLEEKIILRTRELEQAQSQLIQSEKMSAIGQLAAGVAHELNNPLGGILGYAQFALEKMKKTGSDGVDDKQWASYIRYLTDIESQSRRCKAIVQNLLRFSRSSRTTDFDDVNINNIIEDTITFVEHQLHMSQIELRVDLDPHLPLVKGSAGQLQQVFTNLIINAMHASEPESTISVTTRFSPALGEFGGTVEIIFKDQGCGICSENLTKIFEPFFTTKEVGKGTGLGLSVSYGIIREHGAEIKIDSVVGKGTTLTVIMPVQKPLGDSDIEVKTLTAN